MNYEKKYKEALELARDYYKANQKLGESEENEVLSDIFPELKESEDERIRKAILNHLKRMWGNSEDDVCGVHVEDAIAWLEKQGESSDQIHYWTEEEIEPIISDYLRGAEHYGGMIGRLRCLKPKSLEKQGEQKAFDYENANIQQKDFAPKSQRTVSAEATEVTYTTEVETGDGGIKALVTGKVVMPKFKVGDRVNKNDREDEEHCILNITNNS